MVSFKEYLKEYLEEKTTSELEESTLAQKKIHNNPSMESLKALARNNDVRFVITKGDEYHKPSLQAGDATKYDHKSISPATSSWHLRGFLKHRNGEYKYTTMGSHDNFPEDHEMLRKLEKHGIKNGNINTVSF